MKDITLKKAIKLYRDNFNKLENEKRCNYTERRIYQEMYDKMKEKLSMKEAINKTNELLTNWSNLGNNRFSCDRFYIFGIRIYYSHEGDNTKDKKSIVIGFRDLENPEYGINYDDDYTYFIHGRLVKIEISDNEKTNKNLP